MRRNRNQELTELFIEFYEDMTEDQLKRKLRRIEQGTTGGNPHNIGMATFEFLAGASTDQTERDIKQVLADTFPHSKLPRAFSEEWDGQ